MLQFDGKLDGYIQRHCMLARVQVAMASTLWASVSGRVVRLQLRPLHPGKPKRVGCAATSAVFGAISIGFPRRLWTLSTVFSALAVLGYES